MTTGTPPPDAPPAAPQSALNDPRVLLHWAFVLSLIGGIIIAVSAIGSAFMMLAFMIPFGAMPMMGGAWGAGAGWFVGMMVWMVVWGVLMGGVVIVGAFRLRADPSTASGWGIAILVAGTLSLFSMGGFMIGALLAIIGGVFAIIATRPGMPAQTAQGRAPP